MTILINDNNDKNEPWPIKDILHVISISKTMYNREPHQELIVLSCGHWLYNMYGDEHKSFKGKDSMGCRACYLGKKK